MSKQKIKNTYKQISATVKCPLCGVGDYHFTHKIVTTPEEMRAMREAGATYQQIADRFNTQISNVYYHLNTNPKQYVQNI